MRVALFDYELPEELIASHPTKERDGARLLVVRSDGLTDRAIVDLPDLLPRGALVVVNDTRVIPARLFGRKVASGGQVEILLARPLPEPGKSRWLALGRSSKPFREGAEVLIDGSTDLLVTIQKKHLDGSLEVELSSKSESIEGALDRCGHVPLPPYLDRPDEPNDRERYQTVFARAPGAVAAPTAGLHLSTTLLERLVERDIRIAPLTLHVGLGTFQPVTVDDLDDHPMHEEWLEVGDDTASAIVEARSRRAPVVAIGTTVVRALESLPAGEPRAFSGLTRLLIQPGYAFRNVDALLTNFHLPRSTLLALVAAFGGRSRVLEAYAHAVRARYRFFSYGDAMLFPVRVGDDELHSSAVTRAGA